ncbi:LysM domain-containing protein [Curtobacterium sp. NPDC089689]|uniref:LysM domain-containing protein n=1 Tax=Curtobacterium sp. NPDC089689 TaxID=3363968 RepID=UPI00382A3C97
MRKAPRTAAALGLVTIGAVTLSSCALLRSPEPVPEPTRTSPSASVSASPTPTPDESSAEALLEASAHPRTPTPEPSEAAAPAPTLSRIAAGTVVAEGNVASPLGSVHFHFRMVSDGDDTFSAQYSGFTSTLPVPVSVSLFEKPRAVGDGLTYRGVGDHQLGGATAAPGSSATVPLDGSGVDPSGLTTLVTYSSAGPDAGVPVELGPGKVLAVTTVRWSVPARTTNVRPVDGGARSNAAGKVTATTPSGAPRSYVVAPDDLIGDVAARFGISVRALVWLNEGVQVFGDDQYLYEGTTLNLDPLAR